MSHIPFPALRAILVFVAVLAAGLAEAQIVSINDAINKAGSLRYTANRLAKAYIQLGMGVEAERSKRILDTAIPMYDRRLTELKNYAPTPEIRETYVALEKSWVGYKDLLIGAAPGQANARKLLPLSEEIVAIANKATGQLATHAGSSQGRLVNISGRQRMLSQRIAKYVQAVAWGVAPDGAQKEIDASRTEFVATMKELTAAKENTLPIREELELGNQQWMFFEAALAGRGPDRKANATSVATTSERILEVMDNVVALYEKIPAK